MGEVFEVGLESLSFVLVDVFPGREAVFNDWYENDHFYAGGVLGPGCLAGRRWYASKSLREARYVGASCPFDDPSAGTNLATYFFTLPSGGEEFRRWVVPEMAKLAALGRMHGFEERRPVSVAFYTFDTVIGDTKTATMPAHVALDHPFPGLLATLATNSPDRAATAPPLLPADSFTLACTWREEEPLIAQADFTPLAPVTLLLTFLPTTPPEDAVTTATLAAGVAEAAGVVPLWAGGFEPIVPGDDSFIGTLR
jgi:hypothetical protein